MYRPELEKAEEMAWEARQDLQEPGVVYREMLPWEEEELNFQEETADLEEQALLGIAEKVEEMLVVEGQDFQMVFKKIGEPFLLEKLRQFQYLRFEEVSHLELLPEKIFPQAGQETLMLKELLADQKKELCRSRWTWKLMKILRP